MKIENPKPAIENPESEIENRQTPDLTIAIMAGGRSRRMGRDKALITVGGVPMLERVARAALGTGLPVVVIGREPPAGWPLEEVTFHHDHYPDTGPLGGLATAFEVRGTSVLLLACDMPLLTTEAIRWLVEQEEGMREGDGIVPSNAGRLEPLYAVYRSSSLRLAESVLRQGERAMKGLITAGEFKRVEMPAWVREGVFNVNDADDANRVIGNRAFT